MKLFGGILVLVMGIIISIVAAWFSVTGMVALFNANAIGVMAMMISLESGKLVGAGWLKLNWTNRNVGFVHRYYLLSAVCVLSLITSLGIYGYLAAGHLEQAAPQANIAVQAQPLQLQLDQKNQQNQQLTQRLNQIDQNIAVFLKNDQASKGLRASGTLKKERDDIQKQIDANNAQINDLNSKLAPLKMQNNEVEAKLGPVKYFAALIGWDADSAVRLVICMIVSVFDIFAVVLLLSALTTFREIYGDRQLPEPEPVEEEDDKWIEIRKTEADDRWDDFFRKSRGSLTDVDLSAFDAPQYDPITVDEVNAEIEALRDEREAEIVEPPVIEPEVIPEVEDRSDYERADMETEVAFDYPDPVAEPNEEIVRLAGLRPDAEREPVIAHEIPVLEQPPEDYVDAQPVDAKEVDRDTLIAILERHPGILNEIEEIVEHDVVTEMSDREKLLDLLEKNPAVINDMAEIITSSLTKNEKPKGAWLD
jgi:hypothetical protein